MAKIWPLRPFWFFVTYSVCGCSVSPHMLADREGLPRKEGVASVVTAVALEGLPKSKTRIVLKSSW